MDYNFTFEWYPSHEDSHAARLAVLHPLANLKGDEADLPQRSRRAADTLLSHWRKRLTEFRTVDPSFKVEGAQLQYARNCWPGGLMGVKVEAKADAEGDQKVVASFKGKAPRLCRMRDICPWCWARRTMMVYRSVAAARGQAIAGTYSYRIFSLINTEFLSFEDNLHDWLHYVAFSVRSLCSFLVGGFTQVVAYPYVADKELTGWRLQARLLGMVEAGVPLRVCPPTRVKRDGVRPASDWVLHGTRDGEEPTNANLLSHIARVCRYPLPMMRYDAAKVLEVLQARKKLRLTETTGLFRGKDAEEDEHEAQE